MTAINNSFNKKSKIEIEKIKMLPDGRMDTKNTAAYLGLSIKTLAMMRTQGTGPKFIKCGRVFYYEEDLKAWLNKSGRAISTAQSLQFKREDS